ncbi:MAG: septum formation initiator family protein [Actinomycetota bacterium]|nr:septum formation initiator family protein [Actinomycetota bacterium]
MRARIGPGTIVVVLVLALCGAMAIEPTRQLVEQRHRIAGMARDLREIERANKALENRIARLNDPDFLEQRAREEIGLIRPGETAYVVMPPTRKTTSSNRQRDSEVAPSAADERAGWFEGLLAFVGLL